MNKATRVWRAVLGAAVVAALLIPAAALAGPGKAKGRPSPPKTPPGAAVASSTPAGSHANAGTGAKGQPAENLERRVSNVLAARDRRFDAASGAISAKIGRVSAIADKVEAAGGDVSTARAYLGTATDSLATARTLEGETATGLKSVPKAANRKVEFAKAKKSGKKAVAQLTVARTNVVLAVRELRSTVKSMRTSTETSVSP